MDLVWISYGSAERSTHPKHREGPGQALEESTSWGLSPPPTPSEPSSPCGSGMGAVVRSARGQGGVNDKGPRGRMGKAPERSRSLRCPSTPGPVPIGPARPYAPQTGRQSARAHKTREPGAQSPSPAFCRAQNAKRRGARAGKPEAGVFWVVRVMNEAHRSFGLGVTPSLV